MCGRQVVPHSSIITIYRKFYSFNAAGVVVVAMAMCGTAKTRRKFRLRRLLERNALCVYEHALEMADVLSLMREKACFS